MGTILRLDVTGRPQGWISKEVAAHAYATDSVVWGLGEDSIRIRGGIQRVSGILSEFNMQPVIAVRGKVVGDFTPALTNAALFRRDGYTCLYCGDVFHKSQLTRDHIHPRSRGGKDTWANVATSCGRCNGHRKGDRLLDECGLELLAVPFTPNEFEWMFLQRERVTGDAFDYLSAHFSVNRNWAA
ncbi:hypothetical protein A3709_20280 [Halioglobus sp. HI00S01]|nr:hypothetical protein A3709_20280 [Halioglobus sp. HI00S01]